MSSNPLDALSDLVAILEVLGLPYAIGGSVASSVHGEPRASADADVLVDLPQERISELVAKLDDGYYISEAAALEAALANSSFNVIDLGSMYKIDIFVAGSSPLDRNQLERRQLVELEGTPGFSAYVTAPEDVVLRKLDWFRAGGGRSDRQWRDVLGVLKMQGESLDVEYLREAARGADLTQELEQAMGEAGL